MAEGEFVIIHGRFSGFQPTNWIAADILRIKDAIFLEHWDVIQDEAAKAGSPCHEQSVQLHGDDSGFPQRSYAMRCPSRLVKETRSFALERQPSWPPGVR